MIVAFLPSPGHREDHLDRMPCPSTGNLVLPMVGLTEQLLGVPGPSDPFVACALGHPSDSSHLVLSKHLVYRDLLL